MGVQWPTCPNCGKKALLGLVKIDDTENLYCRNCVDKAIIKQSKEFNKIKNLKLSKFTVEEFLNIIKRFR